MNSPKWVAGVSIGLIFSTSTFAQELPTPPSPHTFSANVSLVSDYRARGIDLTFNKPALQGSIDYSHASGLYLGNWESNVNSGAGFPGANLEMLFYGGWKSAWNRWALDLGAVYYAYPGSNARVEDGTAITNTHTGKEHTGHVNNKEVYAAVSWKPITLKYSYVLGGFFSIPGTRGSSYVELNVEQPIKDGWSVLLHTGHLYLKNYDKGSYTDWKLGITKDFSHWQLGLSYVGSNAKGDCKKDEPWCFGNKDTGATKTRNAGRDVLVFSIGCSF